MKIYDELPSYKQVLKAKKKNSYPEDISVT